jgi:hypothetical protein
MTHGIDYTAPADLFPSRRYAKGLARYRRFSNSADAIRYAIEDMPEAWLIGTSLDIDGIRFDASAIRELYDRLDFPLARRPVAA